MTSRTLDFAFLRVGGSEASYVKRCFVHTSAYGSACSEKLHDANDM